MHKVKKDELEEIIVERDDGIDYKFQGKLLVDKQHEPNAKYGTEYWCGIIQIYYAEYPQGDRTCKGYILVTRRHQSGLDHNEITVTEAGLVKDMGMVINLILAKFKDGGVMPKWVKSAIDEFKDGRYVEASGVKQKL